MLGMLFVNYAGNNVANVNAGNEAIQGARNEAVQGAVKWFEEEWDFFGSSSWMFCQDYNL